MGLGDFFNLDLSNEILTEECLPEGNLSIKYSSRHQSAWNMGRAVDLLPVSFNAK